MGARTADFFLSGASSCRLLALGSSIFTDIRSAKSPRRRTSSGSAPGMAFAWIYPEMIFLPQNAQCFDHAFHGKVRCPHHSAGQKQALDIIAAVKSDGQLRQFPRGKGSSADIIG